MRKTMKSPGEKIVKDIKRATRKHYSSEEKIRIVLDGLRGEDSIAELCRREGISQGIYYVTVTYSDGSSITPGSDFGTTSYTGSDWGSNDDGSTIVRDWDRIGSQDNDSIQSADGLLFGTAVTVAAPAVGLYNGVQSMLGKVAATRTLSWSAMRTAVTSAAAYRKGTTQVGYALSKHAGRNPQTWGKISGSQATWHAQGMKHMRDIIRGPGSFREVTYNGGLRFIEKRLPDGRGLRLNMDKTFKGFLD